MRAVLVMLVLAVTLPARAEWLEFEDIRGFTRSVFAKDRSKAVVLVFIDTTCPIANAYHPELRRLQKQIGPEGVPFIMIHADPDTEVGKAKKHAGEFGITAGVVIDKGQKWVKRTGATVTPEAVVMNPEGKMVYQGRIDDQYADYGKKRPEPKTRDLEAALAQFLAGKKIAVPKTEAVGCKIFVE